MILVSQEKIDAFVAKGWWGRETLGGIFLDTAQQQPSMFAVADPPNRAELFGGAPQHWSCLLYTSPSPRDGLLSRMPSSA